MTFSWRTEDAALFIFLAGLGANRQRCLQLLRRSPQPHLFAVGPAEVLGAVYPPKVVLFDVTEDPRAGPDGMFYFGAATLRAKIVEVLGLNPSSTMII